MEINYIYKYKSSPKKTPIAPEWDCELYEFLLDKSITKDLIKYVSHYDKLGISIENHAWKNYNIFSWEETIFGTLKKLIKESYQKLISENHISFSEKLWINGWIYWGRPNVHIPIHNHACHPNSFLSGTICLTTCDVNTEFHIPILSADKQVGPLVLNSLEGRMKLFPSYLPHSVTPLKEGDVETRYSIGFDIVTNDTINQFKHNTPTLENVIPF